MKDIPNKVDNVDKLSASEFNSFYKGSKNLIRMFFNTLSEADQEQMAKSVFMFAQVAGQYNLTSSGTPNFTFTPKTYGDAQAPEPTSYEQGLSLGFFPNYSATTGQTATIKIGSLAAVPLYFSDKTTLFPHNHIRNDLFILCKYDVGINGFYVIENGSGITTRALNVNDGDCNNVNQTGIYRTLASDANKPGLSTGEGMMFHMDTSDGSADYKAQIHIDIDNNLLSFRSKDTGAWSPYVYLVVNGGDYTPRVGASASDNSIRHGGTPTAGFSFTGSKNIQWNTGSINPYPALSSTSVSNVSYFYADNAFFQHRATGLASLFVPYVYYRKPDLLAANNNYSCVEFEDHDGLNSGNFTIRAGTFSISGLNINGLSLHQNGRGNIEIATSYATYTVLPRSLYLDTTYGVTESVFAEQLVDVDQHASHYYFNRSLSGYTGSNIYFEDSCNAAVTNDHMIFKRNGSQVGSIQSTLTGTNYNVTSDSRAKENIEEIEDDNFGDDLLKIPNKKYKFKGTDVEKRDMVAEDIYEWCPEATTGKPGEVDEDKNPILMQVDYSKMVPRLVALCKNQDKQIKKLSKRLKKLEGKK